MKKITLFFLFVISSWAYAQEHVIVLVDVSKSIHQEHFRQTRDVVENVLLGNPINNGNFHLNMDAKSPIKFKSGTPLVSSGKKLLIMPFGETKWMNGPFAPKTIRSTGEIASYFESTYPKYVTDQRTYLDLARAKAAQIAKSQGINEYLLLIASDNINDDYGPNAKPNYTDTQRLLVENFDTSSNPYNQENIGRLDFDLDINLKIRIYKADITSYKPPTLTPSVTKDEPSKSVCKLKFTSYANGTRKKAKDIEANPVTLRWAINDAPKGTNFTLSIRSTTGNRENNATFTTTSNSYKVELPNDSYKITVSSAICVADTTYVKVKVGGSGGGLLFFLILLVLLGLGGYWFYKKSQERKLRSLSSDNTDDFSSNTSDFNDTDNYNDPEGF